MVLTAARATLEGPLLRGGRFLVGEAPARPRRDGAAMIPPEVRVEMRRLVLRLHWRIETVARRFGVHYSTVRRALESGPESGEVTSGNILEPYKPFVVQRLTEAPELS